MKKKLVVVSMERTAMERHVIDLQKYFEGQIAVSGCFYQGNENFPSRIEGDLILLTSQELTAKVWNAIDPDTPIVYLERTLSRQQAINLKENLSYSRAFFVDYREDTALQMISRLTEFGVRGVRLIPVGRESSRESLTALREKGTRVAITAGMQSYCPIELENVIDLGWAPIDAKTILEISMILHIYNEHLEAKLLRYMQQVITSERSIMYFLKSAIFSKNIYRAMMESMEDGVIITDRFGQVTNWNRTVLELLKIPGDDKLTAETLGSRLPSALTEVMRSDALLWNEMIFFPGIRQNLIVTKQTINVFGNSEGYMLIVKGLAGVQRQNARIRRQMHKNLYRAKYSFDDILGNSEKIRQLKKTAVRIAAVDGTVLITGESGTGKELFAQSIHNASKRREMPFVAINCAALSPSLLESELFGYERGAFTGSKPEGHVGVFEMAHRGTVFLDEVGELPMNVQAKLLRVLEEREVRRVGGTENIPIDVRVIAATNQDLPTLIREKLFRQDLYYRLNVLPLPLIPLRERRSDILILAEYFLSRLSSTKKIMTPRLREVLYRYPWEGNGRELNNCMQYMAYLSADVLDVDLLPSYIRRGAPNAAPKAELPVAVPDGGGDTLGEAILDVLRKDAVGREELTTLLNQKGIAVSEYRVRRKLRDMKQQGLVEYGRGRHGIAITGAEK